MAAVDVSWLEELRSFVAIPSVSADSAHADDVRRAAEWVRDFVRRSGDAEVLPFGERELVVGDIGSTDGAGAPTVMLYGHVDVQPPEPLDKWDSPPFELVERDGWLYGRGVADDKGQLYLLLKAAQLLHERNALPVNVRVVCDGEEEVGGHTIVDFLRDDERGADVCVIYDGVMLRRDLPVFQSAKRGLIAFRVRVRAGQTDLHSGLYGGVALNAVHALVQMLSALLARDGRLAEPLRAGTISPSDDELADWRALPPGAEALADRGAVPLDEHAADEFYVRTWAEPSLDVNGIVGGKPGLRNTTIPATASAEFTIRLAPGQDVEAIGAAAERMLRAAAPRGATLEIEWDGSPPALVDPTAPAFNLGLDGFERGFGVRPLVVRGGGTLPVMPALAARGIPAIRSGFGVPESNIHAPNERLPVEYVERGVHTSCELLTALGRLRGH